MVEKKEKRRFRTARILAKTVLPILIMATVLLGYSTTFLIEEGLIEEVTRLKEMGYERGMVSMQGLGYKEILTYLDEEYTLEEAIYVLKRDTRHFAKRQLTWFRREQDVTWVNKDEFDYDDERALNFMLDICKQHGIL